VTYQLSSDPEAQQELAMQLVQDRLLKKEVGSDYGRYLGSFLSVRGQVRADLFETGSRVIAYVSFPTGMNPTTVEDGYVSELRRYAESQGFADRFRFVHAEY
jgi:hypothetical protein